MHKKDHSSPAVELDNEPDINEADRKAMRVMRVKDILKKSEDIYCLWDHLPARNWKPSLRMGSAVVMMGKHAYVYAGRSANIESDLLLLNAGTWKWKKQSQLG